MAAPHEGEAPPMPLCRNVDEAIAAVARGPPPMEPNAAVCEAVLAEKREAAMLVRREFDGMEGGKLPRASLGWKKYGVKQGVELFTRIVGSHVYCMGRTVMPYSVERVIGFLSWFPSRFVWDDKMAQARVVCRVAPATTVQQSIGVSIFGTSPREVCMCSTVMRHGRDGFVIAVRSVHHPSAPVPPGCTRATLFYGGYMLERVSESKARVTYMAGLDPGGSVPQWIVNRTVPTRPMFLTVIRDKIRAYPHDADRVARLLAAIDEETRTGVSTPRPTSAGPGGGGGGGGERAGGAASGAADKLVTLEPRTLPDWVSLWRPLLPHYMRRHCHVGRLRVTFVEGRPQDRQLLSIGKPRLYCAMAVGPLPTPPQSAREMEFLRARKMAEAAEAAELEAKAGGRHKSSIMGTLVGTTTGAVSSVVGGVFKGLGSAVSLTGSMLGAMTDVMGVTSSVHDITMCAWPDRSVDVLESTDENMVTACHRYTTQMQASHTPKWDTTFDVPVLDTTFGACIRISVLDSKGLIAGADVPGVDITPDKVVGEAMIPLEDVVRECDGAASVGGRAHVVDRWVRLCQRGTVARFYLDAQRGAVEWPRHLLSVPGTEEDPDTYVAAAMRRTAGGGGAGESKASDVEGAATKGRGLSSRWSPGRRRRNSEDEALPHRGWLRVRLSLAISRVADAHAYAAGRGDDLALRTAVRKLQVEAATETNAMLRLGVGLGSGGGESDNEGDDVDAGIVDTGDGTYLERVRKWPAAEPSEDLTSLVSWVDERLASEVVNVGRGDRDRDNKHASPVASLVGLSHAALTSELAQLFSTLRRLGADDEGEPTNALYSLLRRFVAACMGVLALLCIQVPTAMTEAATWHQPIKSMTMIGAVTAVVLSWHMCDFADTAAWCTGPGCAVAFEEPGWLWWLLTLQWVWIPLGWALGSLRDVVSSVVWHVAGGIGGFLSGLIGHVLPAIPGIGLVVGGGSCCEDSADAATTDDALSSARATVVAASTTASAAAAEIGSAVSAGWNASSSFSLDALCGTAARLSVRAASADLLGGVTGTLAAAAGGAWRDAVVIALGTTAHLGWWLLALAVWVKPWVVYLAAQAVPLSMAWWMWRGRDARLRRLRAATAANAARVLGSGAGVAASTKSSTASVNNDSSGRKRRSLIAAAARTSHVATADDLPSGLSMPMLPSDAGSGRSAGVGSQRRAKNRSMSEEGAVGGGGGHGGNGGGGGDDEAAASGGMRKELSEVFGRSIDDEPSEVNRHMAAVVNGPGGGARGARADSKAVSRFAEVGTPGTAFGTLALLLNSEALVVVGRVGGGAGVRLGRGMSDPEAALVGGEALLFLLMSLVVLRVRGAALWVTQVRSWSHPVHAWAFFVALLAGVALVALCGAEAGIVASGLVVLGWHSAPLRWVRTSAAAYEEYAIKTRELLATAPA